MADALEAAHEKGIIHRDLKPANILLKADGSVKVLDFGLAKYTQPASESASSVDGLQNSPTLTLTMGATQAGMILGTAAYVSPEQAKGKNVDKRTDIWSFGVVLYELTTGRTPFTADDIGDVLAGVIKEQPSCEDVPIELRRLLAKCLEKDPRKRLHDIGDVWELLDQPAPAQLAPAPQTSARMSKLWQATTAVFAIAAALLGGLYFRQPSPPALSAIRFHIAMPGKGNAFTDRLALSPDGRSIAFRDTSGLWLRPLDSLEFRLLPGTEGPQYTPFWSYDSSTLVFSAQNKLKKISVNGGRPISLADIPSGETGGFWTADNRVIIATARAGLLMIPSAGGGMPTPVMQLEPVKLAIRPRRRCRTANISCICAKTQNPS